MKRAKEKRLLKEAKEFLKQSAFVSLWQSVAPRAGTRHHQGWYGGPKPRIPALRKSPQSTGAPSRRRLTLARGAAWPFRRQRSNAETAMRPASNSSASSTLVSAASRVASGLARLHPRQQLLCARCPALSGES